MPAATLTSKGQITIPKEIREMLRLKTGDRVMFVARPDGTIAMRAQNKSILDLIGTLKPADGRTVTLEEMEAAIREGYVKSGLGGIEP